jgi:purine-nucleoside phosphorylase
MKSSAERRSHTLVREQATAAASHIRAAIGDIPAAAVVLGSGLGAFADTLGNSVEVSYDAIPHWPTPSVAGHPGRLVVGESGARRVLALAGRTHLYEGRGVDSVVFAMRVLGVLGVRTVILTNAAGGIAPAFVPGDLMLIDDHINFSGVNPLVGPNDDRFGPRFPDMSDVYSARLRGLAREAAGSAGLSLRHGVYLHVLGPSYETPAEIRAFAVLGADAVGMSTVPEAIVARHMGLEVLGISCISNLAAGRLPGPLSEAEVLETTSRVRDDVIRLLEGILGRL